MRKILIPLLILAMTFMCLGCFAESTENVSLELNTAKLTLYEANDPYLTVLRGGAEQTEDSLPVLVIPTKRNLQLQITVLPRTLKNKKVTLTAEDGDIIRVKANTISALKPGETVLRIASEEDPSALPQYRVLVYQPVTRISVASSENSAAVGGTVSLTPSFLPEDATVKQVTWSSGNEQFATVDENGTVTGVKRGNARIIALAADGSNTRANISLPVVQNAEEITLSADELTVDVKRNGMLKATVLPKDTNDKAVVWSSSDEDIATVNAQGRVTGVAVGDCEIICTSKTTAAVQAKATVHVQQPVKKIVFGESPILYAGDTARITWSVEPADATNPGVMLSSGNESILTVSDDGTLTGVKMGEAVVNAVSTDGSNRRARTKVKVLQHVTGVHMLRHTAYIDVGESPVAGAVLEPEKGTNHNMTWESSDPSVARVQAMPKQSNRVKITGVAKGETTVTGTTEDGGFQTSIKVKVGNYSNTLKITKAYIDGKGNLYFSVKNVSDLNISNIVIEIEAYERGGKVKVPINAKNGKNVVQAYYSKSLSPGKTTPDSRWQVQNRDPEAAFQWMTVRVVQYQINNDWVKNIPRKSQPTYKYKP